jgi:hypothetical protein
MSPLLNSARAVSTNSCRGARRNNTVLRLPTTKGNRYVKEPYASRYRYLRLNERKPYVKVGVRLNSLLRGMSLEDDSTGAAHDVHKAPGEMMDRENDPARAAHDVMRDREKHS